jgi:hypothetical protein
VGAAMMLSWEESDSGHTGLAVSKISDPAVAAEHGCEWKVRQLLYKVACTSKAAVAAKRVVSRTRGFGVLSPYSVIDQLAKLTKAKKHPADLQEELRSSEAFENLADKLADVRIADVRGHRSKNPGHWSPVTGIRSHGTGHWSTVTGTLVPVTRCFCPPKMFSVCPTLPQCRRYIVRPFPCPVGHMYLLD